MVRMVLVPCLLASIVDPYGAMKIHHSFTFGWGLAQLENCIDLTFRIGAIYAAHASYYESARSSEVITK